VNGDGTLATPEIFLSLQKANHGPRLLTGFSFDPASTADNLILWASSGHFAFADVPDWTGKITRISGADLSVVQDAVVGLPRSIRDHLTNQPKFGPDGALYIPQGSNSAYGAPDSGWGNRPERLLSGTILRLDTSRITPGEPLDVKTSGRRWNIRPICYRCAADDLCLRDSQRLVARVDIRWPAPMFLPMAQAPAATRPPAEMFPV